MPRVLMERMQTNAAWRSPPFRVQWGDPLQDVDLATWTLSGAAQGQAARLDLTEAGRFEVFNGQLTIALSAEDCAALGAGRVDFEVMRISPEPPRPILRFVQSNHAGV